MRILLSGGTGFIGSAFARCAWSSGHQILSFSKAELDPPRGWAHLQSSIDSLPWDVVERFQPEAVVHTAWEARPGIYLESPTNHDWVEWSERFIEQATALGVRRFLVVGTCIEYPVTGAPLSEKTPASPTSTYARCKDELRRRLGERLPADGRLAWARLFYPYGPGEHPSRLCSSLIHKLQAGESIQLRTPLSTKDYLYIDDVAAALLRVVEAGYHGPINVGSGDGVTVLSLAQRIATQLGRPELVQAAEVTQPDPYYHVVADISRLRALGWFPQVGLEEGLRRLINARS